MDATADELAGVVDLFGGLTRAELERALAEVAFRDEGKAVDDEAVDEAIEAALETFALIRYEPSADASADGGSSSGADVDDPLFVAGPTAFPRTPDHGEDLPHILEIEPRRLDRAALGEQARERFGEAVDEALAADDRERASFLLDASYDLEAWAPVAVDDQRERLDDTL